MASTLTAIVGVIYLFTALSFFGDGHRGMALAYLAYAIANVGLVMAARGL